MTGILETTFRLRFDLGRTLSDPGSNSFRPKGERSRRAVVARWSRGGRAVVARWSRGEPAQGVFLDPLKNLAYSARISRKAYVCLHKAYVCVRKGAVRLT